MRLSRWKAISLALLLGLGLGYAYAQTVVQQSLGGNEVVRAANGPGGPEAWLAVRTIAGNNVATTSGSGSATSTGIGGMLVWTSTAPTTWTVTLPTTPANGTKQCVTSDTTLTTMVTVQAGGSDTMAATFSNQTLTANTTVACWQYVSANTKWYRVQ